MAALDYLYKATVNRVIDGDTIVLDVDLGFKVINTQVFRLLGINTPELIGSTHEAGLAAKNFVESLLPKGKSIMVKSYKNEKDKYGRYLAEIFIEADDRSVNKRIIEAGHAVEYYL